MPTDKKELLSNLVANWQNTGRSVPNCTSLDEQTHVFHHSLKDEEIENQPCIWVNRNGNDFRVIKQLGVYNFKVLKTFGQSVDEAFDAKWNWVHGDIDDDALDLIFKQPIGNKSGEERLSLLPKGLSTGRGRKVVYRNWIVPVFFDRDTERFSLNLETVGVDRSETFHGKVWESGDAIAWIEEIHKQHAAGGSIIGDMERMQLAAAAQKEAATTMATERPGWWGSF